MTILYRATYAKGLDSTLPGGIYWTGNEYVIYSEDKDDFDRDVAYLRERPERFRNITISSTPVNWNPLDTEPQT